MGGHTLHTKTGYLFIYFLLGLGGRNSTHVSPPPPPLFRCNHARETHKQTAQNPGPKPTGGGGNSYLERRRRGNRAWFFLLWSFAPLTWCWLMVMPTSTAT